MNNEESKSYIDEIVVQCVISFSKTYHLDEKDAAVLKKVLTDEMTLGFKHLITE